MIVVKTIELYKQRVFSGYEMTLHYLRNLLEGLDYLRIFVQTEDDSRFTGSDKDNPESWMRIKLK